MLQDLEEQTQGLVLIVTLPSVGDPHQHTIMDMIVTDVVVDKFFRPDHQSIEIRSRGVTATIASIIHSAIDGARIQENFDVGENVMRVVVVPVAVGFAIAVLQEEALDLLEIIKPQVLMLAQLHFEPPPI
ncbi:MAG TPA: hypothetical protein PKO15_16655 [Fibrobacteria bacterium]|nr:hypothetical protein [Fibrobacteria bacterium]